MRSVEEHWRRRVILFFVSQCISLFGSQVVQMAIVWHVTLHTNSGAWVAVFAVCSYLPQFFMSFLGGVWADRYSWKRLILGADMLIAAATLLMLLGMPHIQTESALLKTMLLMSVIRSAGTGIQSPAVNAALAQIVPEAYRMRYNGINASMQAAVQFAAPAAAAVVLAMYSLRSTLAIDILTAAVGMGMLVCLRLPEGEKREKDVPVWADVIIGARYAYDHAEVRCTLTIYGLFLFLSVPAGYLAGLLVSRAYGDTVWHLTAVELVGFGGMMAGGLLMSFWGGFKRREMTLAAGLNLFGAMAIAMASGAHFAGYLFFMALYGIALTVVQTTITTILQEKTEYSVQGRVFGLMSALYASCYPVGMAFFGPIADWMPLQWLMTASGVALIALAGTVCYGMSLKRNVRD